MSTEIILVTKSKIKRLPLEKDRLSVKGRERESITYKKLSAEEITSNESRRMRMEERKRKKKEESEFIITEIGERR